MTASPPRRSLLPPVWIVLGSALLGCTSAEPNSGSSTQLPANNAASYGSEIIGYKQQRTTAETQGAVSGSALGSSAAAGSPVVSEPSYADVVTQYDEGNGGDDSAPSAELTPAQVAPPAPVNTVGPLPTPSASLPAVPDTGVLTDDAPDGGTGSAPTLADAGADAGMDPEPSVDSGAVPSVDGGADSGSGVVRLAELPEFDQIPETERVPENPFRAAAEMPASTFSIDVDTASYSMARAAIAAGRLPERKSVRVEEFINYFHLHYAQPAAEHPFSVYTELGTCPWNTQNQLLLVGIQGQEVPLVDQPAANLVFLIDVSGSMSEELPLLKSGFRMMARQLRSIDKVSIVTYAGSNQVLLEGASGADQQAILSALDALQSGGSTAGEAGIRRAYELAEAHFIPGGNNRVLLASDGDFNVGISDPEALKQFISTKRPSGVFLSVYGFGSPGVAHNDEVSEALADNGNGIYFFIDSPEEARRAFIHTITGSLLTVAKDVKLQLQFNPTQVKGYRLIGYENRVLTNADFANDSVDAGELGAGLSVTALVELIPAGSSAAIPEAAAGTDPLLIATAQSPSDAEALSPNELTEVTGDALFDVRLRYKGADEDASSLLTQRLSAADVSRAEPSMKFTFASGVAELAMQLRGSQYLNNHRSAELLQQLRRTLPADAEGAVDEFITLTQAAHSL
jgi:Ca-activated chloride channel homolog